MRHEPWLSVHARQHPDRVALEVGAEALTWRELHARAAGVLDARPGERVGIGLPAGVDFAVALHACLLRRAVAVPLDLRLAAEERAARSGGLDSVLEGPPPPAAPAEAAFAEDDVAIVLHTSGTTAAPKAVPLTYGNLRANAVGTALALGLRRDEKWLCPAPLTHVAGLMVLMRSLVYGTAAVLGPPRFDAQATAARLERGDITIVTVVPTMLGRILDAGFRGAGGLRCVLLGGGPVPAPLAERALAAGLPVAQTYGLTEASAGVTISEPGDPRTAGWPLPGVNVRLAADGEILVEGPIVSGGGVLATGDLGRFDERGRLTVIGRKADTIVTGGENVAPAEVEAVLLAHPAVAEAGVFARPDPEWGERLCAQVVLRAQVGANAEELRAFCAQRLAGFKVPKSIEIVASLPRTASGKLLRRQLT